MKTSTDRILTTHVGSLPRSQAVTDVIFGRERDEQIDETAYASIISTAVVDVVRKQRLAGVDVVSDGEMSKISYATYIKDRLTGFDGDSQRDPPADLQDFPNFLARMAAIGGTPKYRRPRCMSAIAPKDSKPLRDDLAWFRSALDQQANRVEGPAVEAFMNAASPGVIALFQPNDFYPSHEAYLEAIAEAMRPEYEAIVAAGFILQIDAPDLGLGGHTLFKHRPVHEYRRLADLHVSVLNHALRNCPADRMRMHICWGNYEGPHHHDVPMEVVLPIALKAKPQALLFEASNPRHAHEWTCFRDCQLPADKILIPGVLDSVTNFVEHPLLIAERIERFAGIVGRERIIAGTDCGFSTFAGFGAIDPDIVYAKLQAMNDGARIASERLWGRANRAPAGSSPAANGQLRERLVRYDELRPCTNAFIDTRTPGSDRKENFTIIGPGVAEHPEQHVHIRIPHGFNIGGARQPPGCMNSQHSHKTAEVFVIQQGGFRFKTGVSGDSGSVDLLPGDVISIPVNAFRGFDTLGSETSFMFSVLGGDDPGRVLWAPYVFQRAREYGLVLLQSGRLIDTRRGDVVPADDPPMTATTAAEAARLQVLDSAGIAACTVRRAEFKPCESAPFARFRGVREILLIGPENPAESLPAAPLSWLHGFHVRAIHLDPGATIPLHRRQEEEVLLLHHGKLRVAWADGHFDLEAGDTFSIPVGLAHSFAAIGDATVEFYTVRGGDHPAAPAFE